MIEQRRSVIRSGGVPFRNRCTSARKEIQSVLLRHSINSTSRSDLLIFSETLASEIPWTHVPVDSGAYNEYHHR